MNSSDFTVQNWIEIGRRPIEQLNELPETENDPGAEQILATIQSTPLGKLLKMIASLPEIRQEKVTDVRSQIDHGQYNVSENLDIALDKVLEEFIADS